MSGKPVVAAAMAALSLVGSAYAEFAGSIIEYERGSVTFLSDDDYNDPAAALNAPDRLQGQSIGFLEPVSPFAAPFEQDRLVGGGGGGHLTVQLTNPVAVNAGTRIGIFTNAAIYDPTFTGQAEPVARTLAGREYEAERSAEIWVGADLENMVSVGRHIVNIPTLAFTNLQNSWEIPNPAIPTDFDKPFEGTLADFNGLTLPQMSALLDGSGGGTWIDIDESSLPFDQILYVRIADPLWDDGTALFERRQSVYTDGPNKYADVLIDSINVVPEPSTAAAVLLLLGGAGLRRSRVRRASVQRANLRPAGLRDRH